MALGPILIFDKSTLQSLSVDESVWLEHLFLHNITPIFFIETLGDLEKSMKSGRTPEQIVGNLSLKTPNMSSYPNVHHQELIAGELIGWGEVGMDGRPIISRGRVVTLEGKMGIIHEESIESQAFSRWQKGEFLDLERQIAKKWRRTLSLLDQSEITMGFKEFFRGKQIPKTLTEAKQFADFMINNWDQGAILNLGMNLLGIPSHSQEKILTRWKAEESKPIKSFAPYFSHVLSVDLFYYVASVSNLIQFPHPQTHKIDLAYLYYLPFCMVFVSNDKFHKVIVPEFLNSKQTMLNGSDLKKDLAELDNYYSSLPETEKTKGAMRLASYPPLDKEFMITKLWDKYSPSWRDNALEAKSRENTKGDRKFSNKFIDEITRFEKEAKPIDSVKINSDKAHHIGFHRKAPSIKGKWRIFPPEIGEENVKL